MQALDKAVNRQRLIGEQREYPPHVVGGCRIKFDESASVTPDIAIAVGCLA